MDNFKLMNSEETRNGPGKIFVVPGKSDQINKIIPKSISVKGCANPKEHVLEINKHLPAYLLIQDTMLDKGLCSCRIINTTLLSDLFFFFHRFLQCQAKTYRISFQKRK